MREETTPALFLCNFKLNLKSTYYQRQTNFQAKMYIFAYTHMTAMRARRIVTPMFHVLYRKTILFKILLLLYYSTFYSKHRNSFCVELKNL